MSALEPTFLVEVGVEEIPSRYLPGLIRDWARRLGEGLVAARLAPAADLRAEATPRRLVVTGPVLARQAPREERIRGPRVEQAWRGEEPTPALTGFLRRAGVRLEDLEQEGDGERRYVVARREASRASAAEILPAVVAEAFAALDLPRSMRWGAGTDRFIRPVRWVMLWLGSDALTVELAGVRSGRVTYGNRTDHPGAAAVEGSRHYFDALARLKVMPSITERKAVIAREGARLAAAAGGMVDLDPDLLDEVSCLVEWPTPFIGRFDARFLKVPGPVLATAMKVHQRYFPVLDANGDLMPEFIGVRNGVGTGLDVVRHGNERVLRARLEDAAYFYAEDLKVPLAERRGRLQGMVFHARLGTYADKAERMDRLFRENAPAFALGAGEREVVARALALAKCDLLTHVVEEFPELEGVMGGIYARASGESEAVAAAIEEQYLPRRQGDTIPRTVPGRVVGLIDRIDTVVQAYAAGIEPTGSEDPFGLRRAALGAVRIWVEGDLAPNLSARTFLRSALPTGEARAEGVVEAVLGLLVNRLKSYWEGDPRAGWVDAVLASDDRLGQLRDRLGQLLEKTRDPGWPAYVEATIRIARVLKEPVAPQIREGYSTAAEEELARAARGLGRAPDLASWWTKAVPAAVEAVARLFDDVLVMDPDSSVRAARLALLAAAGQGLTRFWDPVRGG